VPDRWLPRDALVRARQNAENERALAKHERMLARRGGASAEVHDRAAETHERAAAYHDQFADMLTRRSTMRRKEVLAPPEASRR